MENGSKQGRSYYKSYQTIILTTHSLRIQYLECSLLKCYNDNMCVCGVIYLTIRNINNLYIIGGSQMQIGKEEKNVLKKDSAAGKKNICQLVGA